MSPRAAPGMVASKSTLPRPSTSVFQVLMRLVPLLTWQVLTLAVVCLPGAHIPLPFSRRTSTSQSWPWWTCHGLILYLETLLFYPIKSESWSCWSNWSLSATQGRSSIGVGYVHIQLQATLRRAKSPPMDMLAVSRCLPQRGNILKFYVFLIYTDTNILV